MKGMKNDRILEIKDVTVRYGFFVAVSHCSFDVVENEVFGFLGPNGAGKSSIIRAIIGTVGHEGEILFKSKKTTDISRDVFNTLLGIVPQEPSVFMDFSVKENLEIAGRMYNIPEGRLEKRVKELMKDFTLDRFANRPARKLSGGYRRLLSIAISIIHKPRVLIMDEPTVGLDPDIREKIWKLIKGLKKAGVTIILTTHYLDEAEELCDKVAIMEAGKVLACDSPKALIDEYGGNTHITIHVDKVIHFTAERLMKIPEVLSAEVSKRTIKVECPNRHAVKVVRDLVLFLGAPPRRIHPLDSIVREPTLSDAFKNIVEKEVGL